MAKTIRRLVFLLSPLFALMFCYVIYPYMIAMNGDSAIGVLRFMALSVVLLLAAGSMSRCTWLEIKGVYPYSSSDEE